MERHFAPRSLTKQISIQHVGEETLLYDERRHRAFCLDRVASAVWRRCDGEHSLEEIATGASMDLALTVTEETVLVALGQMEKDGLLEAGQGEGGDLAMLGEISRRAMIGRLGVGAALMLPVIAAVAAPRPARALSGCGDCPRSVKNHAPRN